MWRWKKGERNSDAWKVEKASDGYRLSVTTDRYKVYMIHYDMKYLICISKLYLFFKILQKKVLRNFILLLWEYLRSKLNGFMCKQSISLRLSHTINYTHKAVHPCNTWFPRANRPWLNKPIIITWHISLRV